MNIDKNILASLRQQQKTKLSRLDWKSDPADGVQQLQDIHDMLDEALELGKEYMRWIGNNYGRFVDEPGTSTDRTEDRMDKALTAIVNAKRDVVDAQKAQGMIFRPDEDTASGRF